MSAITETTGVETNSADKSKVCFCCHSHAIPRQPKDGQPMSNNHKENLPLFNESLARKKPAQEAVNTLRCISKTTSAEFRGKKTLLLRQRSYTYRSPS